MRLIIALLLLGPILFSCENGPVSSDDSLQSKDYFFDAKGYFAEESTRLAEAGKGLVKEIWFNGEEERLESDSLDWDKELELFLKADINRPAWTEKYTGDTTLSSAGTPERISYTAQEEELRIQQMDISFDPSGKIDEIYIQKEINSLIEKVSQKLNYRPQEGYELSEKSSSNWKGEKEIRIKAFFQ